MKSIRILAAAALALGAAGSIQLLQPPALGQNLGGDNTLFSVDVDLVVLNIAVTDRRGHYITDLKPEDFRVLEDGIPSDGRILGAEPRQ